MTMRRKLAVAVAAVVATGGGIAVSATPAQAFTTYCKQVVADSLTVYSDSTGYNGIATLYHYDVFAATSSDNGRYHGYIYSSSNGQGTWGWISADGRWTNPMRQCP